MSFETCVHKRVKYFKMCEQIFSLTYHVAKYITASTVNWSFSPWTTHLFSQWNWNCREKKKNVKLKSKKISYWNKFKQRAVEYRIVLETLNVWRAGRNSIAVVALGFVMSLFLRSSHLCQLRWVFQQIPLPPKEKVNHLLIAQQNVNQETGCSPLELAQQLFSQFVSKLNFSDSDLHMEICVEILLMISTP